MLRRHVGAGVALALCLGLVVVALLTHRLPAWMMLVAAAGALVALLGVTTDTTRCPNCRAYKGRVLGVDMTAGKRMYGPKDKTPHHLRDTRIRRGPTVTHYRCRACQNEWHVRTEGDVGHRGN